jgi:hypothetical protein
MSNGKNAQVIEGELSPIGFEDPSVDVKRVLEDGEHGVVSRERDSLHRVIRVVFFGFELGLLDGLLEVRKGRMTGSHG